MASISALLGLILYVAAVMATKLFGQVSPEYFGVFILVSSFMVLNLFIAVVVSAMESEVVADLRAEEAEAHSEEQIANAQILAEIRALRAELDHMRSGTP